MDLPVSPFPDDPRMTPLRDGVAARRLAGAVEASELADPQPYRVRAATVPLRRQPDPAGPYDTELLHGEVIDLYGSNGDWAWGQARRDGYVGYLPRAVLGPCDPAPTHRIRDIRAFLYPGPSIKATPLGHLPFAAEVLVVAQHGRFVETPIGFVFADHLELLDTLETDPVAVAERLIGIPYLWGGKSSLGLDCSALVQTACHACGISALRDSDMQEKTLGRAINIPDDPALFERGDLLFWPGHVAMAQGDGQLLHATGAFMKVVSEPLAGALARIAGQGYPLRTVRRLAKA
jgi:hypothetical protein